jgi:hypothetical protein
MCPVVVDRADLVGDLGTSASLQCWSTEQSLPEHGTPDQNLRRHHATRVAVRQK